MLRFCRIEINNFVCFKDIVIEPSIAPERRLTVLRAENGSGKTTLLRALRWGMYGEKGLPGDSTRFSLHPSWWHPNGDGIKTEVQIEFETDGSTRYSTEGSPITTVYHLVRSVTTIGRPTAKDDEPDFRRLNEHTQLMVKESGGTWTRHTAGVDIVVEQLLPWNLRDFFVMDADEATDFVGGGENKVMNRQDVIDKTTAAVHSLLGLDVFKKASERVTALARSFGSQATKAIGDTDLDALWAELEQLRAEEADLTKKIVEQQTQKRELEDQLRRRQDALETELKGIGAAEELRSRLTANRDRSAQATKARKATLSHLAGTLESTDLLASLARSELATAYRLLRPLYEQGHIPLTHLNFVRDLLESGTCVCGQDLSNDDVPRRHVEERIAESATQEDRANYLGQLHDAAKSLRDQAVAPQWETRSRRLAADLAEIDKEIANLALEKRDIDNKLDALDADKIEIIRDEIEALKTQVGSLQSTIAINQSRHPALLSTIDSHQKQIDQRHRNERAAADKRAAEGMAHLVVTILEQAYGTIQAEQVGDLSQRMNRLFTQMAANVSDEDYEEIPRDKATLKMIAEVGLRPVDDKSDNYEIYAFNRRGRSMPPTEINGASRRVLALSFVLALCAESRTHAPLIADSLLNFMSGTVRRNTLRITAENSNQPILLLTGADLQAPSEAELVSRYAGATYTLTGQWDAIAAGSGGDVVHWTEQRPVSLVCPCGPRQYCDICERTGQAELPGWSRRT